MSSEQEKGPSYIIEVTEDSQLNLISGILENRGKKEHLSQKEAGILFLLTHNKNASVSYEKIYKEVWDADFFSKNDKKNISIIVRSLRHKLDKIGLDGHLETIYGYGQIWVDENHF